LTLHTYRTKGIYLNIFKLSSLDEAVAQCEENVFSFELNYSDKVCVFKFAPVRGTKENEDWSYEKLRCVDLRLVNDISEGKGKAVPLQAWSGPEGSRKLIFPDFMTMAQDGGKVVSLTHRPPLPPGNTPGTHFC
jgi:hypothetical protein